MNIDLETLRQLAQAWLPALLDAAVSRAAAEMIRHDLAAARAVWVKQAPSEPEKAEREKSSFLKYRDASDRIADFHSLRHTFITNLARGKVHPKNAQALARHSSINLTMNVYTHTVLGDLADDVGKLPALPAPKPDEKQADALAATGTDGPEWPDNDPRRRTRRRSELGFSCQIGSNSGDAWRGGGDGSRGTADAKNLAKPVELSRFGERCRPKPKDDVQAPEWRNWQTRRIQNPV